MITTISLKDNIAFISSQHHREFLESTLEDLLAYQLFKKNASINNRIVLLRDSSGQRMRVFYKPGCKAYVYKHMLYILHNK
jgi:hypothetical protein